jgi:hypothetical protein
MRWSKHLSSLTAALAAAAIATTAMAAPAPIASGPVIKGPTVFQSAVITYDQALDDSDAGSNPGIDVWSDASRTTRLYRSNDNNGQWDYDIAGAYTLNNQAVIIGSRTGSHGPQPSVWRSSGAGSFLTRTDAVGDCEADTTVTGDGRAFYGPFALTRGSTTYPEAYVTYDAALDASDTGSNPGIEVWPSLAAATAKTGRVQRSNDNNGQWDYQVSCVYANQGTLNVIGARSSNGGATWQPRVWVTLEGGFLTQYNGIQ